MKGSSFRTAIVLQTHDPCQKETLFFSLMLIRNKVSKLWLICWMCLSCLALSYPFFPLCSVTAQPLKSAGKQHVHSYWIFLFTYLFLVPWTFHFLWGGWGVKIFPGLPTNEAKLGLKFFLRPGPQRGGKWVWYGKSFHQFGYIGTTFLFIGITRKKP